MEIITESPIYLRTHYISYQGVSTRILEAGSDQSSEAIVFIHGVPGSADDWKLLADRASLFTRVIALDLPGFGKADNPEDFPQHIPGHAAYFDGVLKALGVKRVHLVMHGFGTVLGLYWAVHHPHAFCSAILINGGLIPGACWHRLTRISRTPLLGELLQAMTSRDGLHSRLQRDVPRQLPAEFQGRLSANYDWATKKAVLKLFRNVGNIDAVNSLLAKALKSQPRPTLVIWGERDPYLSAQYANLQREVLPDSKLVMLAESGHWPFADNHPAVCAEMLLFLRRQILGIKAKPKAKKARYDLAI